MNIKPSSNNASQIHIITVTNTQPHFNTLVENKMIFRIEHT